MGRERGNGRKEGRRWRKGEKEGDRERDDKKTREVGRGRWREYEGGRKLIKIPLKSGVFATLSYNEGGGGEETK